MNRRATYVPRHSWQVRGTLINCAVIFAAVIVWAVVR